ncbi:MAG: hypothetical protein Q4C54_07985 [Clostridia bacterium]|nr:hypothetical protein [Clostridia bacterium]
MKKFVSVMLALVLMMTACAAMAETAGYILGGVQTEDGSMVTIADAEFPVFVFVMDNETMECAFGVEDEMVGGTVAVEATEDEDILALTATLENGEVMNLYAVISEDVVLLEQDGSVLVLVNSELLDEAA